jgi:hypothetical protein
MKIWLQIAMVGGLLSGCCGSHDPESPASKHEISVLDAVCAQHEKTPVHGIEFVESDGYRLVCFPLNGQRIWVMLNPKTEPYYKQIPQGNYSITKADFEAVTKSGDGAPTVLACLESHRSEK